MSFNELNQNFGKRMKEMDKINQELEKQILKLEKELQTEQERNKILNSQNESISAQNSEITAEIQKINKLKNQYKIDFEQLTDDHYSLTEQLSQKNSDLRKDKKEIERQGRRLAEMEQMNDKLEIEKNSHERTTQALKNQLDTQIKTMNDILAVEKES